MQKVFCFETRNTSAEEEVNELLKKMSPNWRLGSIRVDSFGWGEMIYADFPCPLHIYHMTTVVMEKVKKEKQ